MTADGGAALNQAKVVLADHATALAHGEEAARQAHSAAMAIFGEGEVAELIPMTIDCRSVQAGISLAELMVRLDIETSRSAVRRLAQGRGLRLDGAILEAGDVMLNPEATQWRISLGKKRHFDVRVTE